MPPHRLSIILTDETYWWVFGEATREHKKAHEHVADLIDLAKAAADKQRQEEHPESSESAA